LTASRYSADIDLNNLNTSHALAILGIEPGSRVLDIGAADGSVAQPLVDRGCRVVAVERDPAAARAAERICERVIVGDVEALDLAQSLDGASFDVVLLLDVLEHLHDPIATLKAVAERLAPSGRMIASVPNVTHAAVRLQLLSGRFQYTDTGLLDRTHLHFFDRPGLEQMLGEAGLTVIERLRTVAGLTDTEIPIDPDAFQPETVALAMSGEDAQTYQFVYVVAPGERTEKAEAASLGEALQRRAIEAEHLRAEAEAYVEVLRGRIGELERELADAAERESEACERVEALEAELRSRMGELEILHTDLRHARLDVAVKDEQLAVLQAELRPIRATLQQMERLGGYVRHRLGTTGSKRFPRIYRTLKRVIDAARERGS
jgi:2-polyprenyl-3-methyl-5-hydroxy-6-metoxy-1,4-benzoquinol methylase